MQTKAATFLTLILLAVLTLAACVPVPPPAAPVAAPPEDPITQLERLGALKAQGLLTEEEFNAQKAKILGL